MKIKIKPISAKELIKKMEAHVPLPMHATPELAEALRQKGREITPDDELQVSSFMDSGDLGGVICVIEGKNDSGRILTSITHLRMKADHPLKASIIAYQKSRVSKLAKER